MNRNEPGSRSEMLTLLKSRLVDLGHDDASTIGMLDALATLPPSPEDSTQTSPQPTLWPNEANRDDVRQPRFFTMNKHASGGLGDVYYARDIELNRSVALKEIQPRYLNDPASRSRFLREAEITGRLEHPGIVPVYSLGAHANGSPYYAMRFIHGESLRQALRRFHKSAGSGNDDETTHTKEASQGPGYESLEFRGLLARFISACDAVAYAHSRRIIHRDLKPDNIMLGPFGETLVVDWGLAKPFVCGDSSSPLNHPNGDPPDDPLTFSDSSLLDETVPGSALGTPAYMSPEQARGETIRLGPATDVYGLGATLYALLTGHAPIQAVSLAEALDRVNEGRYPTPRQLIRSIPPALDAICRKALALDPARRYATPTELATDLQRWLADEPISALREPPIHRLSRWVRRHKPVAVAVVLALLGTALAGVGLGIAYRRETAISADLRLARADSDRWLDETLSAIADYYTGVGSEVLLGQREFQGLRDRLLERPLSFYEKFAHEFDRPGAPADPERRFLLARGLADLAGVLRIVGRSSEARFQLDRAKGLLESSGDAPTDFESALLEARLVDEIGQTHVDAGRPIDAIRAFQRAVESHERCHRMVPESQSASLGLSSSLENLATAYLSVGDSQNAIEPLQRSLALLEQVRPTYGPGGPPLEYLASQGQTVSQLAVSYAQIGDFQTGSEVARRAIQEIGLALKRFPDNTSLRFALSNASVNLGLCLLRLNHYAESDNVLRQPIKDLEQAVVAQPNVPELRHALANALLYCGNARWQDQRLDAADPPLRRSIELYDGLVSEFPDRPDYLNGLCAVCGSLASSLATRGRFEESFPLFERAIRLREDLSNSEEITIQIVEGHSSLLFNYATALAYRGRHADAIPLLRRAVELRGLLVESQPSYFYGRLGLANALDELATVLHELGDDVESVSIHRRSIASFEAILVERPELAQVHRELGGAWNNLASTLNGSGERRQALEALEAIEHALEEEARYRDLLRGSSPPNENTAGYNFTRAAILLTLNRGRDALASLRVVVEDANASRRLLMSAVSKSLELIDIIPDERVNEALSIAVIGLRRADQLSPFSLSGLHSGPDLAPLEGDPDFRQLEAEILDRDFPPNPFE